MLILNTILKSKLSWIGLIKLGRELISISLESGETSKSIANISAQNRVYYGIVLFFKQNIYFPPKSKKTHKIIFEFINGKKKSTNGKEFYYWKHLKMLVQYFRNCREKVDYESKHLNSSNMQIYQDKIQNVIETLNSFERN